MADVELLEPLDSTDILDPWEVLDAKEAVEPSIEPLADSGELALWSGVEGLDMLELWASGALAPGGGGAADLTTSMKSWICSDSDSR
jgi:hypothetical protein